MSQPMSPPFVLNTSSLYKVGAPTRCGYGQRGHYLANVEKAAAVWERRVANSTDLELWAGHVARAVVTGSGHTSTTWMMDFLSESPSVIAPPVSDVCIPAGSCWPGGKGEALPMAEKLRQRHGEAASLVTLFKGPCNVCHLPCLLGVCARHGLKVVGLIRNPLDHWHSQNRRDPALPHHNMLRWVFDNSALAQHWSDPHCLLIRYEDTSSALGATRRRTFDTLFDFLGLPPLTPSMLPRCCEPDRITAAAANSSCLTAISEVGVHHKQGDTLGKGCKAQRQPLVHKVEPWRSEPKMVLTAQAMLRRVSIETASQKASVKSSTVYRLARAFRYYEDDPLVRQALSWEATLG